MMITVTIIVMSHGYRPGLVVSALKAAPAKCTVSLVRPPQSRTGAGSTGSGWNIHVLPCFSPSDSPTTASEVHLNRSLASLGIPQENNQPHLAVPLAGIS